MIHRTVVACSRKVRRPRWLVDSSRGFTCQRKPAHVMMNVTRAIVAAAKTLSSVTEDIPPPEHPYRCPRPLGSRPRRATTLRPEAKERLQLSVAGAGMVAAVGRCCARGRDGPDADAASGIAELQLAQTTRGVVPTLPTHGRVSRVTLTGGRAPAARTCANARARTHVRATPVQNTGVEPDPHVQPWGPHVASQYGSGPASHPFCFWLHFQRKPELALTDRGTVRMPSAMANSRAKAKSTEERAVSGMRISPSA